MITAPMANPPQGGPAQPCEGPVFFACYVAYSISNVAETRDKALSCSREVESMRWCPVVFLTNGVLKVTHGGIELRAPVL